MKFPIDAFRHDPDGSWTTTRRVTISGPRGDRIALGQNFTIRESFVIGGVGVFTLLTDYEQIRDADG